MFGINQSLARRVQENNHNAKQEKQMLDGIKEAAAQITADPISERVMSTATANMRMAAMSIVLQTALILDEGQDEDNEMLPNELLDNLTLEAFDEDGDDEDDSIDPIVKALLSANIADAFSSLGVDDDVIEDIFSTDLDVADTAIESACATVIENLPADGKPLDDFATAFVFGWEEDESGYDSVMFDKAGRQKQHLTEGHKSTRVVNGQTLHYKAVSAIRHGEHVFINKRISGHAKLSADQKGALNKARKKAHTGLAMFKRGHSLLKGVAMNAYKHLSEKSLNFLSAVGAGSKEKGRKKHEHHIKTQNGIQRNAMERKLNAFK